MLILFVLILAYLIGAVPNGYIFAKNCANLDIREHGSGNVGATNVARVTGYKVGLIVALLDILKGVIAVTVAQYFLLPEYSMTFVFIAAVLAIIGHNWSVFLSFNGGKGVATSAGILIKLFPWVILVFFIIWVIFIILTKIVSIGSILGAISIPFSIYFIYNNQTSYLIFGILVGLLIIFSHRSNINRLINGNENKMSWPPGDKDEK
ncbi:MAG: glycerol-3-phosphate 1-O-acyltransferase PlsY [Halanaerobiales bacterium]|nr:glycerol-3-phosphate 1-O-acyltransferase PlsY [Halanaerobiales bacterium]